MKLVQVAIMFVLFPALSAGSQGDDAVRRVSFCDVVSAPESFDTKLISTEVLISSSYHSVAVYDPACMPTEKMT
jgi:hypothetical protein